MQKHPNPLFRALVASTLAGASLIPSAAAAERPNILIIVTDDMGYSDIGCYGGEIPTPNLDALARGGMRFRQFYSNPACAPTRASLLTGLDAHRAGQGANHVTPDDPFWSKINSPAYHAMKVGQTVTMPQLLQKAGYQTFMTGKWHQGEKDGMRPLQRGFDRYYGVLWGAVTNQFRPGQEEFRHDDQIITSFPENFYTTDTFTDYALQFLRESDPKQPFFLYVAYTAPHLPWDAHEEDIKKYRGIYQNNWEKIRQARFVRLKKLGLLPESAELPPWDRSSQAWEQVPQHNNWNERMARYAAMVDNIDQNIGRLIEELRQRGELDNTLIFYLHDNGQWAVNLGAGAVWAEACNTPFRLFKGATHEGGIRSPLIAHWPGKIPANTIQQNQYAHVRDILPTILDILQLEHPGGEGGLLPTDGGSLWPALRDPNFAENRPLAIEYSGNAMLRDGNWKLVRSAPWLVVENPDIPAGAGTGAWELYNLENDPTESHNLAEQEPDRVRAMSAQYQRWADDVGVVPGEVVRRELQNYLQNKKP